MSQGVSPRLSLTLFLLLLFVAPGIHADRLLIEAVEEAEASTTDRPRHGQTMDQVRSRFGEPERRVEPVGEPPIARWEYAGFTVYFEHDRVLRAVMRRD
ncbi:MAG: hypothetical protein JJT90_01690 [Ectothiorhodospiraceae bacterium]|nr:hypothetical protein [Ectothiorhodospiraceae bacterium]